MHISLYQALRSIKIADEKSAEVVSAVEEFMAMKMSDATKGVEARLDGLEAQLKATNWLLGFIGVLIAITGLAPAVVKLF